MERQGKETNDAYFRGKVESEINSVWEAVENLCERIEKVEERTDKNQEFIAMGRGQLKLMLFVIPLIVTVVVMLMKHFLDKG